MIGHEAPPGSSRRTALRRPDLCPSVLAIQNYVKCPRPEKKNQVALNHPLFPPPLPSSLSTPPLLHGPRVLVSQKQDGRQWQVARGSCPCAGGVYLDACASQAEEGGALPFLVWRFGLVLCRLCDASFRSWYVNPCTICCLLYFHADLLPAVKVSSQLSAFCPNYSPLLQLLLI